MTRAQLEHLIRAAARVAGDTEIVVIGSQAILGSHPDAHGALLVSREADIYPRNRPERAIDIDANLGDSSPFDATYGYYAHGVGPETIVAAAGWEQRLVPVTSENTGGATGWCLEVHDLLISKCAAGRDRDWAFVEEALRQRLADPEVLLLRLRELPVSQERRAGIEHLLGAAIIRARSN